MDEHYWFFVAPHIVPRLVDFFREHLQMVQHFSDKLFLKFFLLAKYCGLLCVTCVTKTCDSRDIYEAIIIKLVQHSLVFTARL